MTTRAPAETMSNLDNDLSTAPAEPEYRYDEASGFFWKQASPDEWISLREGAFRRELKSRGLRDKADPRNGEMLAPLDAKVMEIEQAKRVKFACQLAGYRAGEHSVGGEKILVTASMRLLTPVKGEWPLLAEVLRRLFVGQEETGTGDPIKIDQRDHWLAWVQHWLRSLYSGHVTRGLCLCVAGEPDSGKTLHGMLLKALAGGKEGKPYDFMIGRDNFNRELFEASLQMIDDENADTRIDARREFGAQIKKIVGNSDMKLRGMHRDGIVLSPTWRLVALVNLEAERLMVMPPIENDIADKILMLKGYKLPRPEPGSDLAASRCWPMPMPTDTADEQKAFWDALRAELPAFVWYLLNEYTPPSAVAGGRFGVRAWQHPEILRELQQFSPHVRLWQLILRSGVVFRKKIGNPSEVGAAAWEDCAEWTGSAEQLEELLKGSDSGLTTEERKEIPKPSWLGTQLRAVEKIWGERVARFHRTGTGRRWVLRRCQEYEGQ